MVMTEEKVSSQKILHQNTTNLRLKSFQWDHTNLEPGNNKIKIKINLPAGMRRHIEKLFHFTTALLKDM
jgi:hypothetical protein